MSPLVLIALNVHGILAGLSKMIWSSSLYRIVMSVGEGIGVLLSDI